MSKEQRAKLYEGCKSHLIEQKNGNLEPSMLYNMADEMSVPYGDNPDFNIQEPTRLHYLIYTIYVYQKLDEKYGEQLINIIFYNTKDKINLFSKSKNYVIADEEEFKNLQKFMYQNGQFFDEDGLIFKELIPVFLEVYGRNLNAFKEFLEQNYLPTFKNILLCSAYSHGCYEIAKEDIDVLEKMSKLEVIESDNVAVLGEIFIAYLRDVIKSKDGGYINIDYMLQFKEYLNTTLQCPEKADILFNEYRAFNQDLAILEGMLLNNLYNYTPTPYLEIQLRKNQYLRISAEEEALLDFYQENPQFKIIGNILKYCIENELELASNLFVQADNGIAYYANLILGTHTVKCDIADNLCLLLGKEEAYYEQPTTDSDESCIIL